MIQNFATFFILLFIHIIKELGIFLGAFGKSEDAASFLCLENICFCAIFAIRLWICLTYQLAVELEMPPALRSYVPIKIFLKKLLRFATFVDTIWIFWLLPVVLLASPSHPGSKELTVLSLFSSSYSHRYTGGWFGSRCWNRQCQYATDGRS